MDGRRAHAAGQPNDVTRTVRIDATTFADALVGLRREMAGAIQRLHLGDHGEFELDARVITPGRNSPGRAELFGRLWTPGTASMVAVRIEARSDTSGSRLTMIPTGELPRPLARHPENYVALARAALDELCEELLFHASFVRREHSPRA